MAHHDDTISGLVGKLVTEMEVNYNADRYYQVFKHHEDVPKAIPHIYRSMRVLEGHGMTSGCIKEWCYIHEGKTMILKERTTYNDETRTICHSVVGGDIANDYKTFNATLLVKGKPRPHVSRVVASPLQGSAIAPPVQPAHKHHFSLCDKLDSFGAKLDKLAHKPHVSLCDKLDKLAHRPHHSFRDKLAHKPHFSLCKPVSPPMTGSGMSKQEYSPPILTYEDPPLEWDGTCVMWIIDYEKINEDCPIPISYLAFLHRIIEDLNDHFCAYD
ncbi:hypothetical protein MKX01_031178 [Papaver californicum]|nr:hypothetical protein MKX01_031178 [Papaver californicum]